MKKIIVLCFMLLAQTTQGEVLVRFKDQTSHVWSSYYLKGAEYCTMKTFGEYCVEKADVVSIKEVPPETEGSEYSVSSVGEASATTTERRDENLEALKSLDCSQLRAANTERALEQYRNECLTREEQVAWDEQQYRKAEQIRQARAEEKEAKAEAERIAREKERERRKNEKPQRRTWR
jgi:hypothetical protein